jgi:eukaryotic-like serine/threonine-protein kinase
MDHGIPCDCSTRTRDATSGFGRTAPLSSDLVEHRELSLTDGEPQRPIDGETPSARGIARSVRDQGASSVDFALERRSVSAPEISRSVGCHHDESSRSPLTSGRVYSEVVRKSSQFRKLFELARGGMGRIDLVSAREGTFLRLHAVKRLHLPGRDDPEFREMFLDEARIAGLIRHANVVSVLDVDEDEDGPFLVMDYVEGVSLKNVIVRHHKSKEPIPIQLCARISSQIAQGLHAAHELTTPDGKPLELVHRDVSPQNVIVGFDGVVRVTDFGVAKAVGRSTRTDAGVLKGKHGYFSPEQLRFEEPDRRSDLFALGVILYEMLTTRRLYANREGTEGAHRTLNEPPPDVGEIRPDAPPALVELLFDLLAKDPKDRPKTAREVARRLEAIGAESSSSEGLLEITEYMETTFGAERAEMRERVARGLEEVDPVAAQSMRADSARAALTPKDGGHLPTSTIEEPPLSTTVHSPLLPTPADSTEAGPGAMTKGAKTAVPSEHRRTWLVVLALAPVVVASALAISVATSHRAKNTESPPRQQPTPEPLATAEPDASSSTESALPETAPRASASEAPLSSAPTRTVKPREAARQKPSASTESSAKPPPTPFDGLGARE